MASTLQITDGTTTVNLLNTSGLYLKEKGWKPAVAQEDENGDYLDMIEVITCTWMETDDDSRAETLKTLKRLDRKAREHWRRRLVDGWVWLAAATHSETDTRYGIIKSIDIKELDTRHWAADGPVEVKLVIKHILWWHVAPNGTPATVVSSTSVANKEVSTTHNHVQITAANVKGDAPALALIELVRSAGDFIPGFPYVISRRRGASADLDNFISNLTVNADLLSGSGLTINADAKLPGGQYGRWSSTTDTNTARFALPNDTEYFAGTYHLYVLCRAGADNLATVSFYPVYSTSVPTPYQPKQPVQASALPTLEWQSYYVGTINILPRGIVSGYTSPAEYTIGIKCEKSGSVNFDLAGVWLVPAYDGIFQVDEFYRPASTFHTTVIDGRAERAYAVLSGAVTKANMGYQGRFITLEPNTNQRLYFYQAITDFSADPYWDPTQVANVTVKAIYRYTSLRGND